MRELDIGIDLDGVLYNFEYALQEYLVRYKGFDRTEIPLPSTSWNFWKNQWGFTLDEFLSHCDDATDLGFMFIEGGVEPGGLEMMESLRAKGHHLHVITSRSFGTKSPHNTTDWLVRNEVPYDSLIMTHHKSMIRPDIMLDDLDKNFHEMWSVGVECWLRDQAWNRHVDTPFRVSSLAEFEAQVDRKAAS